MGIYDQSNKTDRMNYTEAPCEYCTVYKVKNNLVHRTRYTENMERMDIIYLVHLIVFPSGKGEKVVRGEHLGQTAVVCD
jgi:hypothetical protein